MPESITDVTGQQFPVPAAELDGHSVLHQFHSGILDFSTQVICQPLRFGCQQQHLEVLRSTDSHNPVLMTHLCIRLCLQPCIDVLFHLHCKDSEFCSEGVIQEGDHDLKAGLLRDDTPDAITRISFRLRLALVFAEEHEWQAVMYTLLRQNGNALLFQCSFQE